MPFVSINQKDLSRVLTICGQISPRRSDIEVFTYTKVEISKDEAKFSALNPTAFYSANLPFASLEGVTESFSFLIKTEVFVSAVALLSDEIVGLDIDLEKHTLIAQGSKAKHTLRIDTQKVDEFLTPKETGELRAELSLNSDDFLAALRSSFISVGQPKNVYEPKFLNVCLTLRNEDKKMVVVSTDRYRVTKVTLDVKVEKTSEAVAGEPTNFLVLPKGLQLLVSAVSTEKEIKVNFFEDLAQFTFDNQFIYLRYGEGAYPDYDKIIPQSFTCNFEVNSKEILAALKQVYLSARTNTINKSIILEINPTDKTLNLNSKTDDGYSSEATISIENYQGTQENWKQAFNADYLIDYISTVSQDKILWEANPGKPSVLSPFGEKEKQIYLVIGLK